MEKLDWLEKRRKGIGGSDAASILGLSKWRTPYQLYLEKRGEAPAVEETEQMRWGKTLEPLIRQRYATETGRNVLVPNGILVHPAHPWMLANVDGLPEPDRVLEIKTARYDTDWGQPGTDEIPEYYLTQVQHYLAVTGRPVGDVAVLFGGSEFCLYEVPADLELQELLIDREREFWERVESGNPPDPVGLADIEIRFGRDSTEKRVQANAETAAAVAELKVLKTSLKRQDDLEAVIKGHMQDADTLVDGETVLATWKKAKGRESLDVAAFKATHPELYASFAKRGKQNRRFILK